MSEEYSPEVQELVDEISTQLREALSDFEGQTVEDQAEILKKMMYDALTVYRIPSTEVEVQCISTSSGAVDIQVCVPQEWAWIFDECEEEDEEDIEWGID